MNDIDEKLDEILVDSVGMDFCENDDCTHYQQYLNAKQEIKQLISDITTETVQKDRLANTRFWKVKIDKFFDKEIAIYEAELKGAK